MFIDRLHVHVVSQLAYMSYSKFEECSKSNTCQRPPCTPKEWAEYEFPDQVRFRACMCGGSACACHMWCMHVVSMHVCSCWLTAHVIAQMLEYLKGTEDSGSPNKKTIQKPVSSWYRVATILPNKEL